MGKIKNMVISGMSFMAICILISACSSNKRNDNSDSNGLNLNKNEIQLINISTLPSLFDSFDITDKEEVYKVADYLTSLNKIKTKLNPSDYSGMSYNIKIQLKKSTERMFILSGNKFFMEKDRFIYEIPYKEAIKLDTIVANILENNQSKSGESSIEGTIISINAEASGRDFSCIIKDEYNATYNIDLKTAKIIDSTGSGWMILHEKDVVKAFYKGDKGTVGAPIVASTVFLKKVAQ